jgi:peroxiredoxin
MGVEQGPGEEPAAGNGSRRSRLPAWLFAVQGVISVAVLGAIVAAVIALRSQGPQVIRLDHPDAAVQADLQDTPIAAPPSIVLPDLHPDGPVGPIGHGAPQKGQPAPDFALRDAGGHRVQLSDLRGKVVVVNFWATWCGPCKQEFPELQKVVSTMGDDVVVLALDQAESADRVERFRGQFGATFTILLDSRSEVSKSYLFTGIPDTVIVGRDGLVRDVSLGPLSAGTFRYKISQALAEQ